MKKISIQRSRRDTTVPQNGQSIKGTKNESLAKDYESPLGRTRKTKIAYTLNPPEGDFNKEEIKKIPAYILDGEKMANDKLSEVMISLDLCERGFEKEGRRKAIFAIEAFLVAHYDGLYPPMWALNDIAERFRKWYARRGNTSLDMFFGVDTYKGETPIFKVDAIQHRNEGLYYTIFALKHLFKLTLEEASHMAAERLQGTLNAISEETIKDKYKKSELRNFRKDTEKIFSGWADDKKIQFIKTFPEESFPINKKGKALKALINEKR